MVIQLIEIFKNLETVVAFVNQRSGDLMNTQFHLVAKTKATKTTFGLWIQSFLQKKKIYIYIKNRKKQLILICIKYV